jgi:large subunit ribosomal protein L21
VKDDKVAVFKKKKRKGYKVLRGHRQQFTEIEITKVG